MAAGTAARRFLLHALFRIAHVKTAESQPVDASERRSLEQIEHLVARTSQMAAEETDRGRFYECLLDSAVHASGALAGAIWMRSETHGFELRNELNYLAAGMGEEGEWRESHDRMLEAVLERKAMLAATPSGRDSTALPNATPFTLILSPVVCDDEVRVVVATIHQPHRSPLEQRGAERIVATMSAFAEEFQRNEQLRDLKARRTVARQRRSLCEGRTSQPSFSTHGVRHC